MTVRINANSCKNALGTVFLLATAFFVCSTFISMRSVFADPIAPANAGLQQTGRQSPRSTSRATSNRTVSRSTTSRATASRGTVAATRTAVSRGVAGSRSTASRSITPTRPTSTRSVSSRGNRNQNTNRTVRARTATTQSRVSATGDVMASSRASVNTTYSYLNSRLNTGNYSNIIDSTTGLISADAYANCMDSYYACMDEVCTARSSAKGRCSCAGRATNFLVAEEALERANEELIVLSGQLSLLIATKGKGDDLSAAFSLTEAEQVMNCVSWRDTAAKCQNGDTSTDSAGNDIMQQWYISHPTYQSKDSDTLISGSCSSYTMPYYCAESGNNFGFNIKDINGSSSDILAQLKAWADAKDLAKEYVSDEKKLFGGYTTIAQVVNRLGGNYRTNVSETADNDTLANKWGYKLFEYAHNNVCGRVLDSCFNGIYEACGTPPKVTDSDKNDHSKCMNGATSSCPYNYNSYISVITNENDPNYGDVKLNERGSATNATSTSSAACFGYTTTTTASGIRANSATTTNDPYYSLRGPVADARRSIMQKYLLDSNAACDAYGTNLKNTAQNINYQKVAAEQALQQKRLEFRQDEETTALADAKTAIDNFNECISEIWDCYEQYKDEDSTGWTTARIKSYCSQTSQVPHCYEPMICSPLQSQLTAVIDRPDDKQCTFSADFRENTCRNVVTISEILYGTSTSTPVDITTIWNGETQKNIDSSAVREGCLRKAMNCTLAGDAGEEGYCLRNWKKNYDPTHELAACPDNSASGYGYGQTSLNGTRNGYVTNYCRCMNGYSVWKGACLKSCKAGEYRTETAITGYDAGTCVPCGDGKMPNDPGDNMDPYDCVSNIASCTLPNATKAQKTWSVVDGVGVWGACEAVNCADGYHVEDKKCLSNKKACDVDAIAHATAGEQEWNETTHLYGSCKVTACESPAYKAKSDGTACECAVEDGYAPDDVTGECVLDE